MSPFRTNTPLHDPPPHAIGYYVDPYAPHYADPYAPHYADPNAPHYAAHEPARSWPAYSPFVQPPRPPSRGLEGTYPVGTYQGMHPHASSYSDAGVRASRRHAPPPPMRWVSATLKWSMMPPLPPGLSQATGLTHRWQN